LGRLRERFPYAKLARGPLSAFRRRARRAAVGWAPVAGDTLASGLAPTADERLGEDAVVAPPLSCRHLRFNLSLFRQGVAVGFDFGPRSLEQLTRVAEFLERIVYERNSLRRTPDGVAFTLLNPPLRMGAFSSVRLYWDGVPVPGNRAWLAPADRPHEVALDSIDRARPVAMGVGRRNRFRLALPRPPLPGTHHHVRVEMRSLAVPPLVWLQFADHLRPSAVIG
jgi:hypothetical protein